MPYVELHCHTAFSFLDGASHPVEVAAAAAEQGHAAIGITDHDGLYGAMELAQAAKPLGVRTIVGPDRLRVELQRPFARRDRSRNRHLAQLAERLGVRCVATGDVHAHTRARIPLQDTFVAVRTKSTLDESEPARRGNSSHVLAPPE